MDESLAREVRRRAGNACQYCRVPQECYPTTPFPIDHILARQHGRATVLNNLANSCPHCHAHKGPNIAGIDPVTKKLTRLFNPRRQRWARHFRWDGPVLVGRTAVGRATVVVLALNDAEAVKVRDALMWEGRLPPAR